MKKFIGVALLMFLSFVAGSRMVESSSEEVGLYEVEVMYVDRFSGSFGTSDFVDGDGSITNFPNPTTHPFSINGVSMRIDEMGRITVNLHIYKDAKELSKEYHQFIDKEKDKAFYRRKLKDLGDNSYNEKGIH